MEDTIEINEEAAIADDRRTGACPVCDRAVQGELLSISALPEGLQSIITPNAATADAAEVCGRCVELFDRAQRQIESHATIFEQNDFVLPTPLRMDADERFTGRGITIAFLDSGFYAHPDLTTPNSRILAYHSIFAEEGDQTSLQTNDVASWHGMMTSVVATGNGGGDGFYRGIASEANLVLVKISRTGRISEDQIQKGLESVLTHMDEHQIRVTNVSAGCDFQESYLTNPLSQAGERCARARVTGVCAVGNAGHLPGHSVVPPPSAPSSISVGGLGGRHSLERARPGMYSPPSRATRV